MVDDFVKIRKRNLFFFVYFLVKCLDCEIFSFAEASDDTVID